MKIFGFEFGKKKDDSELIAKITEEVISKTSGYTKLWEMVKESGIFRGKVTQPYDQVSAVRKAVKAIADNVPQAELALYNESTNEEVTNRFSDIMDLLHRPNTYQSGHDFFQDVAGFYALYGEAFIIKIPSIGNTVGTSKRPAELHTYNPSEFQAIKETGTNKLLAWKYNNTRYELNQVIHIKDFNPYDRYRGASPVKAIDGEIQIDYQSLLYNQRFFENDGTPGFMLTTDKNLTQDQRDRLKAAFNVDHRGVDNAHKVKVLDNSLKPVTTATTQKDMQFLEQKKYTEESILGNWRAPKALFNITEALNYATFTGQMKIFWIYTIMPILRKIEEGINFGLIDNMERNIYFAFKLDSVPAFQEDFASKVETGAKLWSMGFTANEINQKLNLGFNDQEWRDHWWIGFGQVTADSALDNAGNSANDNSSSQDPAAGKGQSPIQALTTWKSFIVKQAPIEQRFTKQIRKYFFEIRTQVLRNLNDSSKLNPNGLVDWGAADADIVKIAKPLIRRAIESGVDMGKDLVGRKSVEDDLIAARIESYLVVRANKIVGINKTLKNQIKSNLEKGIADGNSITELADRVRDVFNAAASRALTIARTETAGAVNGGSDLYYKEVGIDKKRWVTAGDELVRESHRQIDGEAVDVDARFKNGLRFPGDQEGEASEVINCRCTLSPII